MDDLGRIVIPKKVRQTVGINDGDMFEIFIDDNNNIVLRSYTIEED